MDPPTVDVTFISPTTFTPTSGAGKQLTPDRVLALWWSNDLDLHGRWSEGGDLLLHAVRNTRVPIGGRVSDCFLEK